ncbi:MAG: hypothetical protein M3R24_14640 [Chloroflexota bacterium]|nr:hypothetical protein [Chloroflexota bacterium]
MIVLDEQLLGRNLETLIAAWYPGAVVYITDLRPNTVIKDDAIPALLGQQVQPTFITINASDFWQKVAINDRFCMICFTLPDARVGEIAPKLRAVFQRLEFSTKAKRMGKVIRVTDTGISYYMSHNQVVQALP